VSRIAVDVGGTFTDCLVLDAKGELRQFKSPTTPTDPAIGFINTLTKAAGGYGQSLKTFVEEIDLLIHGTTLATNTLINGNGAKTAMLTTSGFRDVIEIRRGYKNIRTSMYNVFVPPYRPLIPRFLREEIEERMLYSGDVHTPLNESDVRQAMERLGKQEIESLAVCLLHSYANPTHEDRTAEIAKDLLGDDVYVTSSHDILPIWREWERFSTTVVSAYVGPATKRYLRSLVGKLDGLGFGGNLLLMLSDGLVETVDYCIPRVVSLIGSGPAAAPAAARHAGDLAGFKNLLSFDMGGTSIDIGHIQNNVIPTTTDGWTGDERVAIKMVDVHSAGAGGGSIAWIDSLGLLRVGPQSAGGEPGPVCYGKGGESPTVTDADLILGYVPADFFLGGEIPLDTEKAATALKEHVAKPLKLSVPEAAQAILTTVTAFMADQISEISTQRGYDLREMAIVAGGGAGPVHAAFVAAHLGIPHVIVPTVAATFSAFGMLAMDIGRNYARAYVARAAELDIARVQGLYNDMEREALAGFNRLDVSRRDGVFERTAELRYIGQFHEVEVVVPNGELTPDAIREVIENFHRKHEQLYTFNMRWKGVEFLTFRVKAVVPQASFELSRVPKTKGKASPAVKRRRSCWFDGKQVDTPVFDGQKLRSGHVVHGPAIVEELTTTVVVPIGCTLRVDDWRNYLLTLAKASHDVGDR
jgi:N-methylhydantoinase A